jgi:hypothetical protein
MQGLISSRMAEQPQPSQDAMNGASQESAQGGEALQRAVMAERKILYGKATSDKIVRLLQSGEPAQALAGAAVMVLKTLFDESKGTIPPQIGPQLRDALMADLLELANAAGIQATPEHAEKAKEMMAQFANQGRQAGAQQPQPPMQQPMAA